MLLMVTFAIAMACSDAPTVKPIPDDSMLVINSQEFKNLGIDPSALDLDNPLRQPSTSGNETIVIAFREASDYKSVLARVADGRIQNALVFQIESGITREEIESALVNKNFDGRFIFTDRDSRFEFELENSRVNVERSIAASRVACQDMRDAYQCGAETIDNMGPFSFVLCLAEIPICLAVAIADCLYYGCPDGGL